MYFLWLACFVVLWKELEILLFRHQVLFFCTFKNLGYSIITIEFPEDSDKYLGWAEAATGLGLMVGPALGSLVYGFFQYFYTFIFFAGMLVVGGIILIIALP